MVIFYSYVSHYQKVLIHGDGIKVGIAAFDRIFLWDI